MKRHLRSASIVGLILLSACSSNKVLLPNSSQSNGRTPLAARLPNQPAANNIFEAAKGRTLNDSDIDQYITAPLMGSDRVTAHQLMALMPPTQRGDFLFMTRDGRILSNNETLLLGASLKSIPIVAAARRTASSVSGTRAMDYSDTCSPTNPYAGTGPYTRQVSKCGFATGSASKDPLRSDYTQQWRLWLYVLGNHGAQ